MVTLISNYTRTIHTHFEWANATFVPEHIISAIVFCIQKVASEANRALTKYL